MTMTATAARADFFRLVEGVNADREDVEITTKHGSVFLVSAYEYLQLHETAHLLRSPANARRLFASAEQTRSGRTTLRDLIEVDDESE